MNQIRTKFQETLVEVVNNTLAKKTSIALDKINSLLRLEDLEQEDLKLVGELHAWKAWVFAESQQFQAAIKQYNIAKNYPNTPNGHFHTMEGLANACFQLRKNVEGLKNLEEGILKMETPELRLKLLEKYYEHCENLKPEFEAIIKELIKYYGLKTANQPGKVKERFEWLSESVKKESKALTTLSKTLTALESPTLAIAKVHEEIVRCECAYYKKLLTEKKKQLETALKGYQTLEKKIKDLPTKEAIEALETYEEEDHPAFYKRLAERKITELTTVVKEEVKVSEEKEAEVKIRLKADEVAANEVVANEVAVKEKEVVKTRVAGMESVGTELETAEPIVAIKPIPRPIPRPMCPSQPVGYCYCKCCYEKPVKKYIGNTGKYTLVCCSPSGEYCHCKCEYQKLPLKSSARKSQTHVQVCQYKPVYYCPKTGATKSGTDELIEKAELGQVQKEVKLSTTTATVKGSKDNPIIVE